MRVNLNEQAENELSVIMKNLGFRTPTHAIHRLISKEFKMLSQNTCEDTNNENTIKEPEAI